MGFLKIKEVERKEDGFKFECLDKSDAVAVVLFNSDYSKILLVKQFRAGCNDSIYEIPAGIIDEGEEPINTMYREIREETGYEQIDLTDVIDMGAYYASPGYTSERIHLFKARVKPGSKAKELMLDDAELIETSWVNIDDVLNITNCMKTILGVTKALSIPKKKIGIYGGSFNPLTYLHLLTIERAIEELQLDMCIIEPVNDSYYKRELIDIKYRNKMVEMGIENNNKLVLGNYESRKMIQPNTIETLTHYKEIYGWCEIYFICGSDNLKELNTWAQYEKILEQFKIICVQRDNDNVYKDIILRDKFMIKFKNNIHIIHENVVNDVSSSSIRKLVYSGMSIKYLVPDNVEKYIMENNLYKEEE